MIPETVEEQATLSLKNLDAIMTAAGTDRTKVMKTTIFLTDMNDFAKVNEVYGAFFGESKTGSFLCSSCRSSESSKSGN